MAHPVLLTLATGRSGTTYLYKLALQHYGERARIEHEALSHREARLRKLFRCYSEADQDKLREYPEVQAFMDGVASSSEEKPVLLFGNSLSHLAPLFANRLGDRLKVLLLYRNPVVVAASAYVMSQPSWWLNIPPYDEDDYGNKLTPFDPNTVFKTARDRWDDMTHFDRILYTTIEQINFGFEAVSRIPDNEHMIVRSEDLFKNRELAGRVYELAGLPGGGIDYDSVATNPIWARTRERRPLGEAWKSYRNHPELFTLNEKHLRYRLEDDVLRVAMEKYQLPPGVLPWLRNKSRYWDVRAYVAHTLRSAGLLRPPRSNQGVDPDAG